MYLSPHDIANGLQKSKCVGHNKYIACCPAHDDNSPSLHIALGDDNKILVHCFSGCPQNEIVDTLKGMGLWPEKEKTNEPKAKPVYNPFNSDKDLMAYDHANMVLAIANHDKEMGRHFRYENDKADYQKARATYDRLKPHFYCMNLTGLEWRKLQNRRYAIAVRIMKNFVNNR